MTKEELDQKEKEIIITWKKGGSFAHNIVCLGLQSMAEFDKKRADAVYAKLQSMGY